MNTRYLRAKPARTDTVSAYLVKRNGTILGRVEKLRLPVVRERTVYWWVASSGDKWILVPTRSVGRDRIVKEVSRAS